MTTENPDGRDAGDQGFSFKDNRRIDPETGQARPAGQAGDGADAPESEQQPEAQQGAYTHEDGAGTGDGADAADSFHEPEKEEGSS